MKLYHIISFLPSISYSQPQSHIIPKSSNPKLIYSGIASVNSNSSHTDSIRQILSLFRNCEMVGQPYLNKKRKLKMTDEEEEKLRQDGDGIMRNNNNNIVHHHQLPGIPLAPCNQNNRKPRVTFVLERASLSLAFVGKRYRILNREEHASFLRKKKLDPYRYRPDIVHKALRKIFDSRLCMAGRIEAVYIKTDKGILIKVEPNVNIPESLEKFCAMMSHLLQKLSIKAKGKGGKLLSVVENPVTQYLPVNSLKIGLSYSSQNKADLRDYVGAVSDDVNLVFVVGAMAHGSVGSEYTDDLIAVSGQQLSAGVCLSRICIALEEKWKIL